MKTVNGILSVLIKTIIIIVILQSISCNKFTSCKNISNGDIIFHESLSFQSESLKLITNSKYTHMGIIIIIKGKYYVCEAVQPVKLTLLTEWIEKGKEGHFVVKRLKNSKKILTEDSLLKMKKTGKSFLGRPYDLQFFWDDKKIYCSELVWKIYQRGAGVQLCSLKTFKDFNFSDKKFQKEVKRRYGNNIPRDEKVVSPEQIYNSKLLKLVCQKN